MILIRKRAQEDPAVQKFVDTMQSALAGDKKTALASALADATSPENSLFTQYMRHLAYRPRKVDVAPNPMSKKEISSYGISTLNADETMDRMMLRVLENGEALPENGRRAMSQLLQGGMHRVALRAGLFLINKDLKTLYDSEAAILADRPLTTAEIFKHADVFVSSDGSTSNFAPTIAQAEEMVHKNPLRSESRALVLAASNQLVLPGEAEMLKTVLFQSKPLTIAVQKIETALSTIPVGTDSWASKTTLYRTLVNSLIYDMKGGFGGMLGAREALVAAVIEFGDTQAAEVMMRSLTLGAESQYGLHLDQTGKAHEAWAKLWRFAESRERWTPELVRSVTEHLDEFTKAARAGLPSQTSAQILTNLQLLEKQNPPSLEELSRFVGGGGKQMKVSFGDHSVTLEAVESSVDGRNVRTLKVTEPSRRYSYQGRWQDLEESLAKFAREQRFAALDFTDLAGLDEVKALRLRDGVYLVEKGHWKENRSSPDGNYNRRFDYSINLQDSTQYKAMNVDTRAIELAIRSSQNPSEVRIGDVVFKISKTRETGVTVLAVNSQGISDDHLRRAMELLETETARLKYPKLSYNEMADPRISALLDKKPGYVRTAGKRVLQNGLARVDSSLALDFTMLDQFLKSDRIESAVQIGHFKATLRKALLGLQIRRVDSLKPGSGEYPAFLRTVEERARAAGYDALIVDVVDDPKQFLFYENKMGYQIKKGSAPSVRSYFTPLSSKSVLTAVSADSLSCPGGFSVFGLTPPKK